MNNNRPYSEYSASCARIQDTVPVSTLIYTILISVKNGFAFSILKKEHRLHVSESVIPQTGKTIRRAYPDRISKTYSLLMQV